MNPAIPGSTNNIHTINTRTANNSDACRMSTLNNAKLSSNTNYEIKDSGFSTKFTSKDYYLDYTFLSHRSQISNKTNPSKPTEYIFDLLKTWELNMELIENLVEDEDFTVKNEINQVIKNIKKKFGEKKDLKENLSKVKGKILIEKQIIDELKRKTEENNEYYKEQIKEYEENRDNKDEYLKIFEKKLKEVEIYIHKNTKKGNPKFESYKNFKMNDFIDTNTELICNREELLKEISQIKSSINEVESENKQIRGDLSFTEGKESWKKDEKTKNIFSFYNNHVKIIEDRNKTLRNCYYKLNSNLKHLNYYESKINFIKSILVRRKLKKTPIVAQRSNSFIPFNNVDVDGEEIRENNRDRSNINFDVTRKLSNLMDLSAVLNRNKCDETGLDFGLNKTGYLAKEVGNNLWDISCIGKFD